MLAHCNLKQNMCLHSKQSSLFFLLCTALWWQIERRSGPLKRLEQTFENEHVIIPSFERTQYHGLGIKANRLMIV